ncbi:MAG: hypothetical protein RL088_2530 [Verrucomicrobiota bacterium]|jgi:GNAT superfamily N-acetyltransferase
MYLLASAENIRELWIIPAMALFGILALCWENWPKRRPPTLCWRCGTLARREGGDYVCPNCGWTFEKDGRFRIPVRTSPISACRLRRYCAADFDTCVDIYRLNEPGRFPTGAQYIEEFSGELRDGRTLFVVCEVDGIVRGCGGIARIRERPDLVSLTYGMVHPSYHGKGFGTVMLLGRLSLLPTDGGATWIPCMATVDASAPFYARFGFSGRKFSDEAGSEFWNYFSCLNDADVERCRGSLADADVTNHCFGETVPLREQLVAKWTEVEPGKPEAS